MEEIARVYAEALFERREGARQARRRFASSWAQFADAVAESRDLQVFLFSPYFSSAEKRDGIARAVSGPSPS